MRRFLDEATAYTDRKNEKHRDSGSLALSSEGTDLDCHCHQQYDVVQTRSSSDVLLN